MATVAYLDTHVVAWLFAGLPELLSAEARTTVEQHDVLISPMVVLELQYLLETKRVTQPPEVVLGVLQTDIGLGVCTESFPAVARLAIEQSWTRDPFDRLIVAQAALHGAPLVTKDTVMRRHYAKAVW
jgi:PIN domain nuclease of toxin-antitoxin system